MIEEKKNKPGKNGAWWQPAVVVFFKFSGLIVVPVIAGLILGRFLDKKYDTEPWLFVAVTAVSFAVSMTLLVFDALKEFKKLDK